MVYQASDQLTLHVVNLYQLTTHVVNLHQLTTHVAQCLLLSVSVLFFLH